MVFKKVCFECGAKEEKLYEGKCLKCFKTDVLPIKEIKEINLKICNQCSKIHYNSGFYTVDEIEEMLPTIVKNRMIIDPNYILKKLDINNFEVRGSKLSFDISVDCDLKK